MRAADVAKASFGPKTLGAMIVALVVYVFVSIFVALAVTVAADVFAVVVDLLLLGDRPNLVQLIAVVLGAVAGIWAARLVCDLAFPAYQPRSVFWMFVAVVTMITINKMSGTFRTAEIILGGQYLMTLVAAYYYFWHERSPITGQTGLVRSD
ncbi:hypothetical protein [Aminobacter sp. AP02]|uniref:hypothetical protein n=1 Tax=Aminobacter sp. AP02 TaxID=2135737 RepID=UPI000D6B0396|nr:hypothetical protein [Aminobacter sp. AP02]PWK60739.1 hypothetical protein C8K44_1363 [Aminobacter sp. AP02]